jgi:hypothetical protein
MHAEGSPMALASHIPRYNAVELIDFDALEPEIVRRPPGARLRAWAKLEEAERRVDAFDWVTHVVREPRRLTRFIGDFVSAYLLTFEATLQIAQEQAVPERFQGWLDCQPDYDVLCRGLRTLRNLEAHIRAGALTAARQRSAHSRFAGGTDPAQTVAWLLPPISVADLQSLKKSGRKISESELGTWNALVESEVASELMREGVRRLLTIVSQAESEFAGVS